VCSHTYTCTNRHCYCLLIRYHQMLLNIWRDHTLYYPSISSSLFLFVYFCVRERRGVSLCSILCMVDKYKLICTRTCTCVEFYKYALFQFNSIRSLPIFVNGIHLFIPQSLYLYFCLYSIMPRADQCIHSRDSLTRQRSLGSSRGWLRTMRHLFMALFCR